MKTILVMGERLNDWLYYETGFEQLHPIPPIHEWMEEQGWMYNDDWFCRPTETKFTKIYALEFDTDEMATMFMLKWA